MLACSIFLVKLFSFFQFNLKLQMLYKTSREVPVSFIIVGPIAKKEHLATGMYTNSGD